MHSPACRHRQQPAPRDHQEPASGEVGTRAPLLPTSRTGASGSTQGLGEHTPQPEWQGLEVPREQPLTPGRLDPLGPCCLLRRGRLWACWDEAIQAQGWLHAHRCPSLGARAGAPSPDRSRALPRGLTAEAPGHPGNRGLPSSVRLDSSACEHRIRSA